MTDEMERERDEKMAAAEHQGALDLDEDGTLVESDRPAGVREGEAEEAGSAAVDELRGELDSLNDRHLRLAAEFDNYRKRNERERDALAARLQVDLVRPLLEVLDDLERVSTAGGEAGSSAESVAEGVRLVEKKFRSVLEAAGVEVVEAAGEPFDPATMEALMTVPTDDPAADEVVADVFQKGYRYRDALIRPARVRVLKFDESAGE